MATEISQSDLRNMIAEIMRSLDRGESFIVSRYGVPVGELRPLRRHRWVDTAAVIATFRGAAPIDAGRFGRDLDRWIN